MQMYFCVIHFTQFIYLFVRELVMHNFVVRGLSFVGATAMFSVVCMAPCAEDIQPLTTAATSDYIQSGLYTGELLREVNSILGNNVNFNPANYTASDYSNEWISDARSVVDTYLETLPSPTVLKSGESSGKAQAIAYAINCAEWSMNKGRGHNLADESTYMFVSHYIDIDTYYTDTSLSFLTDGASRSEAPKYYCKWITDDDRNAYDTYLGLHQVNSKANFLYEGFRSICSLNGDVNDIDKLRKTSDKVNDTLFGVAASYSSYDAFDSWGGIYTVTQEIFKKTAESPETRLSDLYTDFFEDEDILRGIDSDIKAAALQSSFAMAGALLLGFVTGGLIEGVAECALWSLCDFGEAVLTSEIDAALTLQLRYSYHVREPARMYDYYMDSI